MPPPHSDTTVASHFAASEAALGAARRVIPTGATSAVRLATRPTPVVFERGAGPRLTDIDGHSYIDYVLGYGPLMLGHDPRDVIDAVKGSIESHLLLGGQHRLEARLGELVSTTVPSAEMTCFSTTGSEAVAAALRIARAHTDRPLIAKFEGHYHGWLDGVAVNTPGTPAAAGTGEVEPLPSTGGVAVSDAVAVLRWNDEQALRRLVASRGGELAALILEPVPQTGLIEPLPGFLESAARLVRSVGALVIFDEVVTGFRLALGGAQQRYGVEPDLTVLAKALGAGFPVSAVTGRADIMDVVANGTVGHMGTFNGHPPSFAAACAAIEAYRAEGLYDRLEELSNDLAGGLTAAAASTGSALKVRQLGPMVWTWFGHEDLDSYAAVQRTDHGANQHFGARLLQRGIHIQPRGTWLLSAAHGATEVEESIEVAASVLAEMADAGVGVLERTP